MKQLKSGRRSGMTGVMRKQRGALTLFSAILILILITAAVLFAARMGVVETRLSANELRAQQAFHNAEAAVEAASMYMLANQIRILSSRADAFDDGLGGTTGDGWFAAGFEKWQDCVSYVATEGHPCNGAVSDPDPATLWFYDDPATTDTAVIDSLLDTSDLPGLPIGSTARLTMLLCFIVDLDDPDDPCGDPPTSSEDEIQTSLVIWLLGYGYSDCTDVDDPETCQGNATIAKPISNYRVLRGSPTVPFVSRPTYPPNGTVEIVGNPNGGGVGVSLTTWLNANAPGGADGCGTGVSDPFDGSDATWQTCDYQEWYHTEELPEGVECTDNNCLCGSGGNDITQFLSWRKPNATAADCVLGTFTGGVCMGLDIIVDDGFPCDLFEFYFGEERTNYAAIMAAAHPQIYPDCEDLDENSSGLIWITGECSPNAAQIGTPEFPVTLITAGPSTSIVGNTIIFGLLYAFDGVPGMTNEFKAGGGAVVYGSAVVDTTFAQSAAGGTFQVVHNAGVNTRAAGIAGIGGVNGGWRDWGLPEITGW